MYSTCAFVHVCYVQREPQVDQDKQTKAKREVGNGKRVAQCGRSQTIDSNHVEQLTQIAHCSEGLLHGSFIVFENYVSNATVVFESVIRQICLISTVIRMQWKQECTKATFSFIVKFLSLVPVAPWFLELLVKKDLSHW